MAESSVEQTTTVDGGTAAQSNESAQPTLNDVYKEFNVDEVASTFRPQQQAPQQPQPQHTPVNTAPDPLLDANGFKAWTENQARIAAQTGQTLSQLTGAVQQMQAAQIRAKEAQDISAAVQTVKEAGFDAEPDFIEIALGQKARQDKRFLTLFNNREQNPVAWKKALAAVANEMKGKYQFRDNANIADNVRAAKTSTQTTQDRPGDKPGNSLDKRFEGLKTPGEFEREWSRLVSGNGY